MILAAIHLTPDAQRVHGLPYHSCITLDEPGRHGLAGWTAHVRGPSVFIVSPPGWKLGVPREQWPVDGDRTLFDFPRSQVILQWRGKLEEMESVQKWSAATANGEDKKK